jgi:twitching motility two-component system response regulator PilH
MISQQQTSSDEQSGMTVSRADVLNKQLRILLVEDDRSLRRYLEVLLRRNHFDVLVAVDGIEAMRVTLTSPVDVVVTDAIMPNLNGYELVRFLRRTPQLSQIPIVLLSALDNREAQSEEYRADIYLSKPVSPEELIECVERLTREHVMT